MSHALIYWIEENSYSVVSIRKVDLANFTGEDIVGKVMKVKWKKDYFPGEIKATGSKAEMLEQEGYWEQVAVDVSFQLEEVEQLTDKSTNRNPDHAVPAASAPFQIEDASSELGKDIQVEPEHMDAEFSFEILQEDGDSVETHEEFVEKNEVSDQQELIYSLKEQLRKRDIEFAKEKAKNKALRRMVKKAIPSEMDPEMFEICPGIMLSKKLDDFLKLSFRDSPSLFLRKLVFDGGILTLAEVAESSVTGAKASGSTARRPALDPTKFKALKDYTVQSCGLRPNTLEMLKFENRIRSICTDARKKQKKLAAERNLQ